MVLRFTVARSSAAPLMLPFIALVSVTNEQQPRVLEEKRENKVLAGDGVILFATFCMRRYSELDSKLAGCFLINRRRDREIDDRRSYEHSDRR